MAVDLNLADPDVWALLDLTRCSEIETLEDYLKRMLDLCASVFAADGASLFLGQDGGDEFVIVKSVGSLARIPADAKIVRGEGIAGVALRDERPLIIGDPRDHPWLADSVIEQREEVGSSMVIPLATPHSSAFGVLNLARRAGTQPFEESDLRRAEAMTSHIALAVGNARLFVRMNMVAWENRELGARLQSIVDCVGFGILVLDPDGRVVECNPLARTLLGNGSHVVELLDELPGWLGEPLAENVSQGQCGLNARSVARHQGRAFILTTTPMPIGGCTVAIEDVSDHEQTERELERTRRLAEIGQFTAAIAHEIRNPLTGIRSAAQFIQTAPEKAAEFGKLIEDEALKLNDLCSQFLDFAKPLTLRLEPVELGSLATSVASRLESEFRAAEVEVEIFTRQPSTVQADRQAMEQIIWNLMLNAIQASPKGGHVRVVVEGPSVSIKDEGQGLDEESRSKVFTPFFTTKARGTGLGLSNVRKIVEAHEATITVQSELGAGAEFTVLMNEGFGA